MTSTNTIRRHRQYDRAWAQYLPTPGQDALLESLKALLDAMTAAQEVLCPHGALVHEGWTPCQECQPLRENALDVLLDAPEDAETLT